MNVVKPVLKVNVMVWPAFIVLGVVKVRPLPIALYAPPAVLHCTETVYVVLAVAAAFIVTVRVYCQLPATVAMVTVPVFVHVAGSVVAVAAVVVSPNPLFVAVKPPATLYNTPEMV